MRRIAALLLTLATGLTAAHAWGNRGHEMVAYIAYQNLDPAIRAKVDALILRNPCAAQWQKGFASLPAGQQSAALFTLAATWPDFIKHAAGKPDPYNCPNAPAFLATDGGKGWNNHLSADIPPDGPEASAIVGYSDTRRHQYWHFIDNPYNPDGTATTPAYSVNALSELALLRDSLRTSTDPDLQSYDLVWIEHLVGDVHQPLHTVQMFSKGLPHGDQGGNLVLNCPPGAAAGTCRAELHALWDGLPGSDSAITAIMSAGDALNQQPHPDTTAIEPGDLQAWADESIALAKKDVYAPPFDKGVANVPPSAISAAYMTAAKADSNHQILLAGLRLAALITDALQ